MTAASAIGPSHLPVPVPALAAPVRQRLDRNDILMRAMLCTVALCLTVAVLLPLWALLSKSFQASDGTFVGLSNFRAYAGHAGLAGSIWNSLWIAVLSTLICVLLAFVYAYGITRTRMPGRAVFRMIAQIPLLAPSLLPAISLVYLFGNQGLAKGLLFGQSIYGPIGIVMGEVFWTFPHALIIITTALSISDARLYEASEALRATGWRTFRTVTLPGARYGLISATFVVFTLVITDFGVPKVIGGQFNVLATDIYKQVVGQQNFQMGAVVGLILLLPAVLAFLVDRRMQQRQSALLSIRAVPHAPKPDRRTDLVFLVVCLVMALAILTVILVAFLASVATFWPYNLVPTFKNYDFDMMDGGGWGSYYNSLTMAALTSLIGTSVIFFGAYLVEKTPRFQRMRGLVQFLALLPLAVPGLVLGLGYIFFFNSPANPLNVLYGTMAILVICTISHFYSVAHLTAVTALKQIDPEFETVSASLRVPFYRTFFRVTLPVCLPAILDIAIYLFVNAMTTVSAVVFLYSPDTTLAAVAVLNMDDAGDVAPAAAMAMMIFLTTAAVRFLYLGLTRGILARSQAWRAR
ncbi:MAG TPA: putative 2-aminoethylphosphonate ABC transporter permease subunit [Geminicoccus sp.]|jgi:iron(III) transport system permease protein|uniref:putative 2-aminoethylphosphonate ABC transporter permease subunit n=1 Tax=Geminicoccus sp. TaxID=2024832 RepID=UPI002E37F8BB|nr:putative 2-aminoethylphosphonate ABC transporter permease subunit [Geminicoccus sp.]HEX2528668.1 putative 2-aminoethylphosphonate ABC transporter permease subunit [Geminicoccus sp.]